MDKNVEVNKGIAMRVSVITIIINIVLSIAKIFAGIIANSGAIISDGVHSASDVFAKCVAVINECGEMKIEKFEM